SEAAPRALGPRPARRVPLRQPNEQDPRDACRSVADFPYDAPTPRPGYSLFSAAPARNARVTAATTASTGMPVMHRKSIGQTSKKQGAESTGTRRISCCKAE